MQPIQLVKLVVIGMGALIVVGIGLLIYGVVTRADHAVPEGVEAPKSKAAAPLMLPAFGEMRVPLPDGCQLVDLRPDGVRLFLRTGPQGPCERIVVIEIASGRVLGTLLIGP